VNDTPSVVREARPSHVLPAFLVILAGVLLLVLPSQPRSKWHETEASTILEEMASGKHHVCPDHAAFSIMQGNKHPVLLVDVRHPEDYQRFTLPGAVNIPLEEILHRRWRPVLESYDYQVVFFSYSDTHAEEAWLITRRAGLKDLKVLEGGLNNFLHSIFLEEVVVERERPDCLEVHTVRFRESARDYFQSGKAIKEAPRPAVPVIKVVEVEMPASGGC
jgi:rhodanese-related sulfurtransferase